MHSFDQVELKTKEVVPKWCFDNTMRELRDLERINRPALRALVSKCLNPTFPIEAIPADGLKGRGLLLPSGEVQRNVGLIVQACIYVDGEGNTPLLELVDPLK